MIKQLNSLIASGQYKNIKLVIADARKAVISDLMHDLNELEKECGRKSFKEINEEINKILKI